MDFTLSKQQQMAQKMYREFAEKRSQKPPGQKVDAEEYFPAETVKKMAKLGMMGIYFPTEVGGAGGDVLSYVMAVEEIARSVAPPALSCRPTPARALPPSMRTAPRSRRQSTCLSCSGEWLGAFAWTEPGRHGRSGPADHRSGKG